jgi:hypothetical protein
VEVDRSHRAVLENLGQLYRHDLSEAYGHLGFVMTAPADDGGFTISDFFVVRALRRTGVGGEAARQVIAMFPGRWRIGFQTYNPGVRRFWSQVASAVAGDHWRTYDDPPVEGRPPDTWITFQTGIDRDHHEAAVSR